MDLLGFGLLLFGMFGISDTVDHLRKEAELQGVIIHHYRSGSSAELRARPEERLERHRNAKRFYSDSVVVNVFSMLVGIGLVGWMATRKEGAPPDS